MRNFSKRLLRVLFTISVSVLLLADVMLRVAVPVDKSLGQILRTLFKVELSSCHHCKISDNLYLLNK